MTLNAAKKSLAEVTAEMQILHKQNNVVQEENGIGHFQDKINEIQ